MYANCGAIIDLPETHLDMVRAGIMEDEVVLIGRQGDDVISADDIADPLGTINYEVVSTITGRLPRVYIK